MRQRQAAVWKSFAQPREGGVAVVLVEVAHLCLNEMFGDLGCDAEHGATPFILDPWTYDIEITLCAQ